jgi:hypothetical protein
MYEFKSANNYRALKTLTKYLKNKEELSPIMEVKKQDGFLCGYICYKITQDRN